MPVAKHSVGHYALGLIGYPIGHSLSPRLHKTALDSVGLSGDYSLFPIPEDGKGLRELLDRLRSGRLQGLNVTVPHKRRVIPLLDDLTPTAQAIGAVNTIAIRDGSLLGENTDAEGFFRDLTRWFPALITNAGGVGGKTALLFGAGGSARAVAYALRTAGFHLVIAARRQEQAHSLARDMRDQQVPPTSPTGTRRDLRIEVLDFPLATPMKLSEIHLMVNCTPLGMRPEVETSPWPVGQPYPSRAAVYDLVYNPKLTRFVKTARTYGLSAVTGRGMLVEQAGLSFTLWTGKPAPLTEMFSAVVKG